MSKFIKNFCEKSYIYYNIDLLKDFKYIIKGNTIRFLLIFDDEDIRKIEYCKSSNESEEYLMKIEDIYNKINEFVNTILNHRKEINTCFDIREIF